MPAQAGTQFFALRCEIRWVPACAGMTESTHSSFNPEVISGLILSRMELAAGQSLALTHQRTQFTLEPSNQ
jgi:hypothetical protein